MKQGTQSRGTGTSPEGWMGREVGGGSGPGDTGTPVADSCECMQKPPQHGEVISLQLK